ncbi:DUF3211 domain-containing protein [Sulfurisphaera ohwakuensis]|uniref:DUF3211 domain-containing protein n=2 Tax=Sulfurisphaera ohwakuensis TaxID=69656 RepID=A0A650CF28_SULOH|nr:DUF3211 domain-containing protein [Sulfurisphaera ohwakuensis]
MMRVEKEIKTNQDIDVVMTIFSDPTFTIPQIFPGVSSVRCAEPEIFEAEGKFLAFSYKVKGRVYKGVDEVRIIYDSDRGNGILYIRKKDNNILQIILEHDNNLTAFLGKRYVSSNLDRLAENIDEIIRLERIKRKI